MMNIEAQYQGYSYQYKYTWHHTILNHEIPWKGLAWHLISPNQQIFKMYMYFEENSQSKIIDQMKIPRNHSKSPSYNSYCSHLHISKLFSALWKKSKHLSIFSLSLIFTWWSSGMASIRGSVFISESLRISCISFSRMDSCLCIYLHHQILISCTIPCGSLFIIISLFSSLSHQF